MGDFNISVGGTNLDLGTNARRIFGQPINVRSTGGFHTIRVTFHIQAATTAALQTAWQAAQTAFNTKDARVILNYDDAAGDAFEDIEQGKNGYLEIRTTIGQTEGDASTAFSIEAVLDVIATFEQTDGIAGQVGEISTTSFLTDGLLEARTLTVAFMVSDDGATSGLAQYTAARSTLLTTYLGVDADGGRDGTTGLALTGENVQRVDEDDNLVFVTLSSEEIVVDFSSEAALRGSELSIQTSEPDAWPDQAGAGPRPTYITVSGRASVDKDALSGDLHDVWAKIRSDVESEMKDQTGDTDAELLSLNIRSDRKASTLSFDAVYIAANTVVFSYARVEQESETPGFRVYVDADGGEVVQKRPGDNPTTRVISINRTGVGLVDLNPRFEGIQFGLGVLAAGFYIFAGRDDQQEGPNQTGDFNNVYTQQSTFIYRRTNAESVNVVEVGI